MPRVSAKTAKSSKKTVEQGPTTPLNGAKESKSSKHQVEHGQATALNGSKELEQLSLTVASGELRAPRRAAVSGDDLGAADLARRVAETLRKLRQDRQLSLDELANRSGVSRAALSQIEGRRTNPTLSVLWKIAVGLEISFIDLLGDPGDASIRVLRSGDSTPLRSADGRTESRMLSPGGANTGTEVFDLRLLPRAIHKSEPHARGTTETLVVLSGNLRLNVDGATQEIAAGDSVFFRADVPHVYENPTGRELRCINIIHYARS
jgi:XRE family transcriptional regulator, regulator of sulfur utilization